MSNMIEEDKLNVISEWFKDSSETAKYVVALNYFQSNYYVDIRVFYKPDGQDEFMPTRKGISISVEHLDKMIEALKKVKDTVRGQ